MRTRALDKPRKMEERRQASRFLPRQRPRSPDRDASRGRLRRLGGSSALPDTLRHCYTEGQRSVLCIIAGEVKHHGACDLPIDKIGALAGVCRTTVQTTLHEARRLGHITVTERPVRGRKNLPNMIHVCSAEWLTWIKRAPSAHRPTGSNAANLASTTKNINIQKGTKTVMFRRSKPFCNEKPGNKRGSYDRREAQQSFGGAP